MTLSNLPRRHGRRAFLGGAAAAALLLPLAGCGGGGDDPRIDDPEFVQTGANGQLTPVRISPGPGGVFVPASSAFAVSWTNEAPPPPQFAARLLRYQEERGGEPRAITEQRTRTDRQGDSFTWDVRRTDDFELDRGGVYYLELRTPAGQEALACFIISNDRSASAPSGRAETVNTGSGGGSLGGVSVSPSPGSTFLSRNAVFQITFPGGAPPPQFTVELRRYQEARGDADQADTEQLVTVDRQGDTWNVRRRDNFVLDPGGVYYLELRAPGEQTLRFAYIVSVER